MSNAVSYPCPAKINLSLSLGPPRPGDGYHPIRSWMVCVSIHDDLTVRKTEGDSRFDIAWADDAPQTSPIDWPVEKDLIFKAHRLVEQQVGRELPVLATLRKRVPVGAGMGGGSSDGAGMLKSLSELFDLRLPMETLIRLASKLGSDVAFFLGPPSAIISDLGQICEPAPLAEPFYMTLIFPPLHCNTAAVYRKFDALNPCARLKPITVESRTVGILTNDLAEAACVVEPRLRELRDQCAAVAGKAVHITGSGAGLFVLQPDLASAVMLARRIRQQCHVAATAVRTL